MNIQRIDEKEFDLLGEEWNALLSRSVSDNVFLRWEWIHTWWTLFGQNRKLFILTARLDGRLAGIAPFYVEREGILGLRTLKLCSEELSPDYLDIIAENGQETIVREEILRYVKDRSGEWDRVFFDNLRVDSLIAADPGGFGGFPHTLEVSFNCPYLKVQGSFDDYIRTRKVLATFNLEKKQARMLRQKPITHLIARDPDSLTRSMEGLFLLHTLRTEAKRIHSAFLSNEVRSFHEKVSRLFLEAGILNFQSYYDGETPVATHYAFNYKKKVYYFQTGINPAYGKWSVGTLLLRQMVKQAFDEGFEEFDFLKGDESYKYLWSQAVHHDMRFEVYNRRWRGCLFFSLGRIRALLRSAKRAFKKQSLPRPE